MQVANKSPIVLQSRGARFLDLVRQNKLNVSPQLTVKANRRFSLDARHTTTPKNDQRKEYFNFSTDVKFNPNASPSSGILTKRKAENESPANSSAKRKRVGFRDPVSSTKEYLITAEEEKHKSNSSGLIRCLVYNEEEFADEEDEGMQKPALLVVKSEPETGIDEPKPLPADEVIDENPQNTDISTTEVDTTTTTKLTQQPTTNEPTTNHHHHHQLTFADKSSLMGYVKDNFSLGEMLQLYTAENEPSEAIRRRAMKQITEQIDLTELMDEYFPPKDEDNDTNLSPDQNKFVLTLVERLSALMKTNRRVKHKLMDVLSEKHSEDFLAHALQENSTARVCEKLTVPKIVDFLVHRANVSCESGEGEEGEFGQMNRKILFHLVESTSSGGGRSLMQDRDEIRRLLVLLFKSKPKIEIFDTAHEFLRDLV